MTDRLKGKLKHLPGARIFSPNRSLPWKLWVAVQVTTCRGRGHIVASPPQAAQLVIARDTTRSKMLYFATVLTVFTRATLC